ncbi:hypothetical protein GVN16_24500 [Emticicia sp. CRIBPO]|uniref:hypothetical protein n=1 Tax=Emticicia sp. CRIBPO TaxID=2683258 RepID=UPI0014125C72|nr:hypothetical protein [Emticicia sp. CRIBPO]NBA88959.1 hypothetical protein [Emticicia sp. CRIBPO]
MFEIEKNSNKKFQLKVLKVNSKAQPGYLLEWTYLDYRTLETDTLEDECAVVFKNFLLKSSLMIELDKDGKNPQWKNLKSLKDKMLLFYSKSGNELCMSNLKSSINSTEDLGDFLDILLPEVKVFMKAYEIFPTESVVRKDTVEEFNDYIFDESKLIQLHKTINLTSLSGKDEIDVNFSSKVSESEFKKYFAENTRLAWDKMGISANDSTRIKMEKTLDDFQPKLSESLHIKVNKTNASVLMFYFIREEWAMLKGGETISYSFKKI